MIYRDVSQVKCSICGAPATRIDEGECSTAPQSMSGMSHSGVLSIKCSVTSSHNQEREYFNSPYRSG